MPDVTRNAVGAVTGGLSLGSYKALEKRRHQLGYDELQELDLQYQIPVSGTTDDTGRLFEVELDFEVEFFNAPEQRDSPLTMPHFTHGFVVVDATTADSIPTLHIGVFADACVGAWKTDDDRECFVGAHVVGQVRTSSWRASTVQFNGLLHLNFQGYGATSENDSILNVGT